MTDFTDHYFLQRLKAGDSLSKNSYKFTEADRDLIDRLLYLGAEGHHHLGGTVSSETPALAPTLAVDTTDGTMAAGTRFFYEFTFVDPQGFESAASPEAFMDTPASVQSPAAPIGLSTVATGGTLPPGNYYYVLSAYTEFDNLETLANLAAFIQVPYVTNTNKNTFTLPVLPGGADGFNVYRRTPSGSSYFHVASIDMTGGSPPTTFTDDGTVVEDCDRSTPQIDSALSRNAIVVGIPGSPPSIPTGYSWRIYRSLTSGVYTSSLLATLTDGSLTYTDTGATTGLGQPPTVGLAPGSPAQIDLTDAREVQGRLPLASVSAFPHEITFSFPGSVVPVLGAQTWVCPFPQATVFSVRAVLGRDLVATGDVQASVVVKQAGGDGLWFDILTAPATIANGTNGVVVDGNTDFVLPELQAGDLIAVDIVASDPANSDMTVVVGLYAYGFTEVTSHVWAPLR